MSFPGVPFQNSIEGGGNIIIPFLQSPNYVPGVSGWRISRNGDAEFASQTLRGPLIVIDPLTGLVVASVSSTGNIAGQYASIENDIILQGQSVADLFNNGRGAVGFFGTFGTAGLLPAPGVGAGVYTNTAWYRARLQGNRLYYFTCTPIPFRRTSGTISSRTGNLRIVVTDDQGNGPFTTGLTPIGLPNGTIDSSGMYGVIYAFSSDPTIFAMTTIQVQANITGDTYALDASGGINFYALDIGPLDASAGFGGGQGTASGSSSHTSIYPATLSQSYKGTGAQLVSTDLWRSDFGDGNGATTSLCIFDGATIRTDLTGAVVTNATLSMFCTTAEESNGSIAFDPSNATAIPGTQATFTGGTYPFDDDWPNPGWLTVDITTDFFADILSGSNAMKISSAIFGLAATRFAGASVANKPYITVNYIA